MKKIITGRKVEVSDKLREQVEKKLGKLDKFFQEDSEMQVTFSEQKNVITVEVTVFDGSTLSRAEEKNEDKYVALDKIVDVLERQIRKNKTNLEKRLRARSITPPPYWDSIEEEEEEPEFKIIRSKRYSLKPMSPEEAVLEMNMLGHDFFIFKDAETFDTSIVYKRKNGGYGLIETEGE